MPELFGRQRLGVRNVPVFPLLGTQEGTFVAAPHGDGHVKLRLPKLSQGLRPLLSQVIADFFHGLDSLRVDFSRRAETGAERFHFARAMDARRLLPSGSDWSFPRTRKPPVSSARLLAQGPQALKGKLRIVLIPGGAYDRSIAPHRTKVPTRPGASVRKPSILPAPFPQGNYHAYPFDRNIFDCWLAPHGGWGSGSTGRQTHPGCWSSAGAAMTTRNKRTSSPRASPPEPTSSGPSPTTRTPAPGTRTPSTTTPTGPRTSTSSFTTSARPTSRTWTSSTASSSRTARGCRPWCCTAACTATACPNPTRGSSSPA